MQVIVDGILVHYTRAGQGRLVVILPGWADTAKSWQPLQSKLADDFDVLVVDLPGFGESQEPPKTWGLDDYAAFVGKLLSKLGLPQPYAVIGHSNGGAIAIRGLARQNISPQKLILLASAGIRNQQSGRNQALKLLAKTGKIVTLPLPASVKQRLRSRLYTAAGSDLLVAEHMQETFKKIVSDDVQADARSISVPTLLVYGDSDTATPLVYGQAFHELINGSTLEIFEGVGHFLHLEQPNKILTHVQGFLQS